MEHLTPALWLLDDYNKFLDETFAAVKVELRKAPSTKKWTPQEIGMILERLIKEQLPDNGRMSDEA